IGVTKLANIGGISVSESGGTPTATYSGTVAEANGLLTTSNAVGTGVTGGGSTSVTCTGTLIQVNTALANLDDTDGTAGSDTLTVNTADGFGNTAGQQTVPVTVNGLPVIAAPTTATVAQNVATAIAGVSVSETGNTRTSGETFTVVLADGAGLLSANTSAGGGGGTITPSNGGTTLTIVGTLAQVNADLTTLADADASTAADTITVNAGDSFGNTAAPQSISATVACFAAGTRIATERGEVSVESLRVGDALLDPAGEASRPAVWIGHRRVDCRAHPKPETVWPVRVRAAAFGDTVPHRDLFLSPDHAVFVDGVLVPIRYLVNGETIARVPVDEVVYYHVELPEHGVLLAEGLPAESYLDIGDRANFANSGGAVRLV